MIWRHAEVIFSSPSKGIRPHLEAINRLGKERLRDTVMADKIVGRAAALLMLYSVPAEVHTGVITTNGPRLATGVASHAWYPPEVSAMPMKNCHIMCQFEELLA